MPETLTPESLQLISLNIWAGRLQDPLMRFFKGHADVDIFCLQEVFDGAENIRPWMKEGTVGDIFTRISDWLPNHRGYFCNEQQGEEGDAMFVSNKLDLTRVNSVFVHRWKNAIEEDGRTLGRAVQFAEFSDRDLKRFSVAHLHGLWNGQGKTDTEERLSQFIRTQRVLDLLLGARVFCGDLNLLPNTQSIAVIEQSGMRNLIKEFGVTNTRSSCYPKPERYADYMFVSSGVEVVDFQVLPDEVSDHLPLYLKFK